MKEQKPAPVVANPKSGKVQGEGDYQAAKTYNDAAKKFAQSGKVEQAARDAEPHDADEAADMKRAEEAGLAKAKDEDPGVAQIHRPAKKK